MAQQTKADLQRRIDELTRQVNILHAQRGQQEGHRFKHCGRTFIGVVFKDAAVERAIWDVASSTISRVDFETTPGTHYDYFEFRCDASPVAGITGFVAAYTYDQGEGIFVERVYQALEVPR